MKDEVEAKLTAAVYSIPRDATNWRSKSETLLLPTQSFLSDPSDGLIADDL